MKCDRKRLSSYLDGALQPEEARQLEEHLSTCERCGADLEAYRQIHGALRFLGHDLAPGQLQREIYRRLEQRERGGVRWPRALLRPAVSIACSAALLVAGFIGWQLVNPGTAPVMTAAFAVQETPDSLDGLRVELVFDRAVSAESLADAIKINPPLPISHRVQENKVELVPQVPLRPGSVYTVVVSNVRDQRGNVQAEPVVLNLQTGPTTILAQESRPPTQDSVAAPSARESTDAGSASSASSDSGPGGVAYSTVPTWSGANRASQALLESNAEVGNRLGAPAGSERLTPIAEQAFQGGAMLFRADTNQIFILVRGNERWLEYANAWRPGDVLPSVGVRPPGTYEPLRGFGKTWRDQPAVQLQLGWPVYEERGSVGLVQAFERGTLVHSFYGVTYVLFGDGSWRTLRFSSQ
jgi:hypothetical protein